MLEDTKVWFSWHEQTLLYNINQAETEEIKWDVHEIGC